MAIQSVTKPMALDETLQSTNTALGGVAKDTTLQSTNGKMDSVITKLQGIIDALGVDTSVYKAAGNKTCAELVSALLVASNLGNVYNITDSGTTTSDFVDGSGKPIHVGDNVAIVDVGTGGSNVYKFDLLAGMVDLSNYIQKSSTSGFVKNDGTIDTTTYQPTEAGKGLSSNDYTSAEKTKLAGIATGATKTEASTTNGNVKINGTETQVYNDAEIQGKLSTATTSSTGNPINFSTLSAQNAESTIIDLEPIQDLHGYDKPWVGGVGKNKLPLTLPNLKTLNVSGTWNNNVYTYDNLTFTVNTDSDGNVIEVNINGSNNSGDNLFFLFGSLSDLTENASYIFTSGNSTGASNTYAINIAGVDTNPTSMTFTYTSALSSSAGRLVIRNNITINNQKFYPMIRLST